MAADEQPKKKLIVDDDWKSQVEREREELSQETAPAGKAAYDEIPEANFLNHIASLATQTMVMLGLVEHPVIGRRTFDGEQARFLIDTVVMLKEKTKGNLSKEETDYLERVVPELQMLFVEVNNAIARAQAEQAMKGGKPPLDPTAGL